MSRSTRLAALHAPIGLDIGADQPGEIAVSILAEVVAVRSGRLAATSGAVTSIGDRDGAIHPELAPGEAYLPQQVGRSGRPVERRYPTSSDAK